MNTMTNLFIAIILLLVTVYCASCSTVALYRATDPTDPIELSYQDTSEEELKAKGVRYRKDESKQVFFIRKTSSDKFKDYTARVLGTPATLAFDTLVCTAAWSQGCLVAPLDEEDWFYLKTQIGAE